MCLDIVGPADSYVEPWTVYVYFSIHVVLQPAAPLEVKHVEVDGSGLMDLGRNMEATFIRDIDEPENGQEATRLIP